MENAKITRLSLDVEAHIAAGADERFTEKEVEEAGGLSELIGSYRDHHAGRIADIHHIPESEVFASDAERFVEVTTFEEE